MRSIGRGQRGILGEGKRLERKKMKYVKNDTISSLSFVKT